MNLEEIRQKKIKELQSQMDEKAAEEQRAIQQINAIESVARQAMTPEAIARYSTLKTAHPEKALQAIALIAQAATKNQLAEKVTDEQFKTLLIKMEPEKKQTKINVVRR